MKRYAKYVEAHQSLVELSKQLAELPSPRSKFFNYLLELTNLAPNTLKMVLCTTDSGIEPGREVKKLLSKELNVSEQALFPENRQTAGSLVSMYKGFSNKTLEYDEFVKDICTTTKAPRKTVISWIYGRRTPRGHAKKRIAALLGSSLSHLFPEREQTDKTR